MRAPGRRPASARFALSFPHRPARATAALGLAGSLAALLAALPLATAAAAVLRVPAAYPRITDALAAAAPFDTVEVAAGTYATSTSGETFPLLLDKNGLVLRGAGAGLSVLDAESQATVVAVATSWARVTGFTIRGGRANHGGGIRVTVGSPEIDHNRIEANAAAVAGSGLYLAAGTAAHVHHNVVWGNLDTDFASGGDPHGVQFDSAHGLAEHNLVGRGDSNGLLITGTGHPTVRNNIFFENGVAPVRGRGICALGDSTSITAYNLFHANAIAAFVVYYAGAFVDVDAATGNALKSWDGIYGNLDGDPLFLDPDADWRLRAGSPAIDAGDPASANDPDGSRADIGPFPFDPAAVDVPAHPGGPGVALAAAGANPARGPARLRLSLPAAGRVRLTVHDVRGRRMATLLEAALPAGGHEAVWDGRGQGGEAAPAGVYLARLETPWGTAVARLVRLRP